MFWVIVKTFVSGEARIIGQICRNSRRIHEIGCVICCDHDIQTSRRDCPFFNLVNVNSSVLSLFYPPKPNSLPGEDLHQHGGHLHIGVSPQFGHNVTLQHGHRHSLGAGQPTIAATFSRHAQPDRRGRWRESETFKSYLQFSFVEVCINSNWTSSPLLPSRLYEHPQRGERARGLPAEGDSAAPVFQSRHRFSGLAARNPSHHHAAQPQVTHTGTQIQRSTRNFERSFFLKTGSVLGLRSNSTKDVISVSRATMPSGKVHVWSNLGLSM